MFELYTFPPLPRKHNRLPEDNNERGSFTSYGKSKCRFALCSTKLFSLLAQFCLYQNKHMEIISGSFIISDQKWFYLEKLLQKCNLKLIRFISIPWTCMLCRTEYIWVLLSVHIYGNMLPISMSDPSLSFLKTNW